jgi:hypothetical protein
MLKTVSTANGLVSPTFSGNVTLSNGNLVIGTSGKGIDFSATPGTGTSELLADYEEGTWTPTDASGAGLTFTGTSNNCYYNRVGNLVTCVFSITYPTTVDASSASIGGLPFTSKNTTSAVAGASGTTYNSLGVSSIAFLLANNSTTCSIRNHSTAGAYSNSQLSGVQIRSVLTYLV